METVVYSVKRAGMLSVYVPLLLHVHLDVVNDTDIIHTNAGNCKTVISFNFSSQNTDSHGKPHYGSSSLVFCHA